MARKPSLLDDLLDSVEGYTADPARAITAGAQRAVSGAATGVAIGQETLERAGNVRLGLELDEDATAVRRVATAMAQRADATRARISQGTRDAMAGSTPRGNLLRGEFDLGPDPSVRGLVNNLAEGVGSSLPSLGAGLLTRGRSLRTQLGAGAVVGGATGGGAAAQEEGARIRGMEQGQLATLPAYLEAIGNGQSPAQARETVAKAAERGAFAATAPVSAIGGALTGGLVGKPVQGAIGAAVGGSRLGQGVASAVAGGLEEGVQEVGEGVAQRLGASAATGEQGREIGAESAANALLGVGAGAATGGAVGAASAGGSESAESGSGAPLPASAPGASAPQQQQPAAPAVVNPARGVLSRAVAKGAEAGAVQNVIVEDPLPAGLNAPGELGLPPDAPDMPLLARDGVADRAAPIAAAMAADRGQPYRAIVGEQMLEIEPRDSLPAEDRRVEAEAAQQVLADPEAAIAAYEALHETDGGRIISTDEAREIFPVYSSGPEGRTRYALAVHEPASFVAKRVWTRRLAAPVSDDREPLVLFTAGGTGAGKTTAVKRDAAAQELKDAADLIYDGNLQNFRSAQEKIEQSLASGRDVGILYVHRDPVTAFAKGVVPRANKESYGRTVPIEAHVSTHIAAAKTILELEQAYADHPRVHIRILNNAGDEITDVRQAVAGVASTDYTALKEQIDAAADQAQREGGLAERVGRYYFPDRYPAGNGGAQPQASAGLQAVGADGQGRGAGQGPAGQGQVGEVVPAGLNSAGAITARKTAEKGGVRTLALERDGKQVGSAEVFVDDYDGSKNALHLNFVGLNPDQRGGNGAAAMRAVVAKAGAGLEYITAEPMSKTSLRAMVRAFGPPESLGDDVREMTLEQALEELPDATKDDGEGGVVPGYRVFGAWRMPAAGLDRRESRRETSASFGVIVAPKPGTKVTTDTGETRPYQRGVDGANQPPAAAPVQREPDLGALQERARAIFKRPAAAAALRKLFGVKGLQAKTIRGSYEGEPELSFQLTGEGLEGDNARQLAVFLGMAFSQDAVIVTKPDPVGVTEDSIPTLELYNTNDTKLSAAQFEQASRALRAAGIDYSEARDGRAIRVLHFGDEAGLEALVGTLQQIAAANGMDALLLHTRSDLYEAQDYRRTLEEAGPEGGAGQRPEVFRALVDQFLVPYTRAIAAAGYRFDPRRYADRYALDEDQLGYLTEKLRAFEPRPATGVLTGAESIPARGKGRPTNADAAWFLQNRAAAFGEIKPDDRSPEALEALSETFAQEVEYQLSKPEGKSAVGWYDRQLKNAMATIAQVHPEIGSDENAGFIFRALLAVTSQGLTVEQNFNAALKAYLRYREAGTLDLTGMTLPGKAAPIAKKNVEKLAALVKAKGLDGARQWMRDTHTIRELKAQGFKDVSGRLDETVRGWHAFGPKIGSFGNNLDGDFDTLTADLWFSRTWNRALGSMFQYSPQREANSLRELRTELVKALNAPGSNAVVDGLTEDERGQIGDVAFDLALAKRLNLAFAAGRYKDRSALNRAAKALTENAEALQDVPRGDPERRWQQQVMREVQAKLERRLDQHISIADLQALLWYQEKELFRLLGAANKASAPLDYQDAAKAAIAQVEGIDRRDDSQDDRVRDAQAQVMRQYGAAMAAARRRDDATIVEAAYPLGSDFLLGQLRKIVKGARISIVAGTDRAALRVAIDRPLSGAEAAKVMGLSGIKRVFSGRFDSGARQAMTDKVPTRFQVPDSVTADRRFAALETEQQAVVDAALAQLKAGGYPKNWLKNASYYFAHNSLQTFVARFYINGATKGAISLRQDRLGSKQQVLRDLAHELAHAADFDAGNEGMYSVMSPRMRIQIGDGGSMNYTGDVIAELHEAWRGDTVLARTLDYPFAEAMEMGPDIVKAEAFAQAVMLYVTDRASLRKHAPVTHQMVQELFANENRSDARGAGALQGALQTTRSRPIFAAAVAREDRGAGGQVDRGEPDRAGAGGGDDRPRAGRLAAGLNSAPPPAAGFDGYTIPSWELGDHLSSEAGKRLDGYRGAAKAGADKLRTFLQDYFLPVRRVQEAVAARGGQITEATDVYGREELYYGRTGERLRQLEDDHVKPLVKAMVAAGVSQADLELYLYAKFAPSRNARIAAINPAMPDGGSGMTDADAAQVLADFDRDGQTAKLEALAKRVRAMNALRLDVLEEAGLLSPGEAELWREEADYVPLKGFAEGVGRGDEPTRLKTGGGFSIGGREAHRALGRKSRAADLLANTVAQVEQAIIRAEKNRVAIALLRLAEENPNPALWEVDKETQVPYLTPSGEVAYRKDPRAQLKDNVVAVKVAGEQHYITLHDKRLAAAMKNLGAAKTGAFLRAFSHINRFLSLTRTMLAPEFVLANFSRDLQTASVNLTGEQSAAMAARVVADVPKAMRAMWGFRRGKSNGGEWSRWATEFTEAGGMTYFVGQQTVEEQQDRIKGLLADANGGTARAMLKLARGTLELVEDVNVAVENATRLAAYAAARRDGMNKSQAARLAKNLTVNFNRKGQAGPVLNALYLFYNASIQGTARFLRASKQPKVQAILGATAVLGFSLGMINRAIGGEDDDGEDRWDKIPDWEKARNLIIFLPGGDGAMVKIPLPYTYNLPFLAGTEIEAMVNSKRAPSSAAANLAEALLTSFSPIGDVDLEGDSATALAKLASPTPADPLIDIAVNRNFFGAPINPERSPFDKTPEPDSELAFPSTNPGVRALAQLLNRATGGDAVRPGLIDVSPGSMVYIFDYLTGGTGSFLERAATATMLAAQGEEVPLRKVPFLRVYASALDERRVTDTFYRLRDDVNLKAELAKAAPAGGYDDPADRRDALFGRRLERRLKLTERQLRQVREKRKAAQLAGDEAATERWQERERAIQLKFNRAYFEAWDRLEE